MFAIRHVGKMIEELSQGDICTPCASFASISGSEKKIIEPPPQPTSAMLVL